MSSNAVARWRRSAVSVFVASVAVNAVLGVWAMLSPGFGETQGNVVITSFLVSAAMLSVLANSPAIGRWVLAGIPVAGAASLVVGFALVTAVVWAHIDVDWYFKLVGTAFALGGGATLAGWLALLRLSGPHVVIRRATFAAIGAQCTVVILAIWVGSVGDPTARLIGVLAVIVAALTLTLPVLSRYTDARDDHAAARVGRYCPGCGSRLGAVRDGEPIHCASCDRTFVISERMNPT